MKIITSDDKTPGIRTFRVQSDRDPSQWYTVKRLRRPPSVRGPVVRNRWMCTCHDFMHRGLITNTHCKHIKRIRVYTITVGGISHVPRGQGITIPDTLVAPRKLKIIKKGT